MSYNGLNINNNIKSNFDIVQKDIQDISDLLQKTYRAMLKLDETVWKAKEKEKIDQEFMPYLKKYSDEYPNYLMARLNFVKDAVEKYEVLDKEQAELKDINTL